MGWDCSGESEKQGDSILWFECVVQSRSKKEQSMVLEDNLQERERMENGTRLRELLAREQTLKTVGVHDSLTARVVDQEDEFEALLVPGSGAAISHLGLPDIGLLTMPEMVSHASHIQECIDSPLIVDVDDGYGSPDNVVRTVREFAKAGVGGLLLEDQARPKRHGYDATKRVVSRQDALTKVRTAVDIRDERDSSVIIIGRTGALGAENGSIEEAIERANAFQDAGADAVYVQGPQSMDQVRRIAKEVNGPQMYEGAESSPRITEDEARELGYDLLHLARGVTYATVLAVKEYSEQLASEGTTAFERIDEEFHEQFDSLQELIGHQEFARTVRDDQE